MNRLIFTIALSLLIISANAQFQKCGVWRWGVKTLTDGQANAILKTDPIPASIEELTADSRPFNHKLSLADEKLERQSDEKQLVKLSCFIIGLKEEKGQGDHDFHIILKSPDTDSTMVAEIPSPDCPEASANPKLKKMYAQLRQWVSDNILTPTGNMKYIEPFAVDIVGVPFWDMAKHGNGASYYGREIHPIINIAKAGALSNLEIVRGNSGLNTEAAFTGDMLPYGIDNTKIKESAVTNPKDLIYVILLAAIFGICGQVIRVFAGIRKLKESNAEGSKDIKSILTQNGSQMLFSLLIALVIGSVAGILAFLSSNQSTFIFDKATIIALLAAGYAGTDLIEGFILKR